MVDSRRTIILDIRVPSLPVAELGGHLGCVNAVAWAPHSSCHICTAGDDSQALIWDLSSMPKRPVEDPILAYNADGEINNLQWSASQPDWVSIAYHDKLQIRKYEQTHKLADDCLIPLFSWISWMSFDVPQWEYSTSFSPDHQDAWFYSQVLPAVAGIIPLALCLRRKKMTASSRKIHILMNANHFTDSPVHMDWVISNSSSHHFLFGQLDKDVQMLELQCLHSGQLEILWWRWRRWWSSY